MDELIARLCSIGLMIVWGALFALAALRNRIREETMRARTRILDDKSKIL